MTTDLAKSIAKLYGLPTIEQLLKNKFDAPKKQPLTSVFKNNAKKPKTKPTKIEAQIDEDGDINLLDSPDDNNENERNTKGGGKDTQKTEENVNISKKKSTNSFQDFNIIFSKYIIYVVSEKIDSNFTNSFNSKNGKEEEDNNSSEKKLEDGDTKNCYEIIRTSLENLIITAVKEMKYKNDLSYTNFVSFVTKIIPSMQSFELIDSHVERSHTCYFSGNQYKGNNGNDGHTTVVMQITYCSEASEAISNYNRLKGENTNPNELKVFITRTWAILANAFTCIQHAGTRIYGVISKKLNLDKLEGGDLDFDAVTKLTKFVAKDLKNPEGIILKEISLLRSAIEVIYDELSPRTKTEFKKENPNFAQYWKTQV